MVGKQNKNGMSAILDTILNFVMGYPCVRS